MKKLLIFSGTTEGRELYDMFKNKYDITLSVATEYGNVMAGQNAQVGRMDAEQMKNYICDNAFDMVVDATHPYATEVSKNIAVACEEKSAELLRLVRQKSDTNGVIIAKNAQECVALIDGMEGNVLLSTGSKELDVYAKVKDFANRLFVRVLPTVDSVARASRLGYKTSHIIAMQGPFSCELNTALIGQFNIKILVTKDGGQAGGFGEKLLAAQKAGVSTLLIRRPNEEGFLMREVVKMLEDKA